MLNYLIIGASSGIGQQLARQLAEAGHKVYGTYCKNSSVSSNERIEFHYLDVLEEPLQLGFLPPVIDGLVYCPGSILLRPFARIRPEDFIQDYHLQVIGAIKVIQSVLPQMKIAGNASIVLFSTLAVQTGLNYHSLVAASKGAIEGLTRSLAAEFAPGIRVNCIAPSLVDTPLAASLINSPQKLEANAQRHPLKRIGTSNDIAGMAEFLLSGKSGWITGQVFHVDGGMSAVKL